MSKKTVLYVRETLFQSVASDIVTFVTVVGIAGAGRYIESAALEWVGIFLLFAFMFMRSDPRRQRISPQEASDKLYEDFGVKPSTTSNPRQSRNQDEE